MYSLTYLLILNVSAQMFQTHRDWREFFLSHFGRENPIFVHLLGLDCKNNMSVLFFDI